MPQLPESNLPVADRLSRLVVAADAECRRSELIADLGVCRSVLFLAPDIQPVDSEVAA